MNPSNVSRPEPGWVQRVLVGRRPKRTLLRAAIWVLLLVAISQFVFLRIRVIGLSMYPTYREHSTGWVNRLAYRFHEPRRGDVVAIRLAGEHLMYMKRIIGLPGEKVAFHGGKAFINGKPLEEPYVHGPCNWEHEDIEVGPDEYYVVGDNRSMDFAEHEQGRPERRRIVGKVIW